MQGFPYFLGALALVACSSSTDVAPPATFSGEPLARFATDGGKLQVDLRTSPNPPTRGVANVELVVRDGAGAPEDGLTLDVVPWMPAMGHGASLHPNVTAAGDGHYVVRDLHLFMPGEWQLRLTFSGPIEDHATPVLQIP